MKNTMQLTAEQEKAVREIDHNLQIIACAGSGKTEVITRRIANILKSKPDVKPENIVAFTFTNKAAESMKNRIEDALEGYAGHIDSMYVGTIHSFCKYILDNYTEKFRGYKILDTVKSHLYVERYYKECGMQDLHLDCYPRNIILFLECIDKMVDAYADSDAWTQEQKDVLDKYINCLYSHGYIDFSLMIFETLRQIDTNPAAKDFISNIKYLIVDEYQDVNDLQETLIRQFAEYGANICVVGDDDQTIYQFRGSNANNIITFSNRYDNVHQVFLDKNFRCAPGIVDVAKCVIKNNTNRLSKEMVSGVKDAKETIEAQRYPDKKYQFKGICKQIEKLHGEGIPYDEMAVLIRKSKVISQICEEMDKAGIPYETDSSAGFFESKYFGLLVSTLQCLEDMNNIKAKLYECWNNILDSASFRKGFKYLRRCNGNGNPALCEIIESFCKETGFLDSEAQDIEDRRMSLDGLVSILKDYDEIYGDWQLSARVSRVLKFIGTRAPEEYKYHSFAQNNSKADAVRIMTVHKAKGLEFNTVFLPELMKREFPVSKVGGKKYWQVLGGIFEENKDKYQSSMEDERKLFYVAVTRAKQNLYIMYELSSQPVSCFVQESSKSSFLKINKADLYYDPKEEEEDSYMSFQSGRDKRKENKSSEWEDRRQKQEYWANVKYARKQLLDYYGTACHFFPAARGDLIRVKNMQPDEVLREARRNNLI